MKTRIQPALILTLFLFFLFHFSSFSQDIIINDDFESDALGTLPNGWVIRYNGTGNDDQKIVDSPVKNGNHSFQVSGSSWAANLSKSVTEMPDEVTLEGWMRAENVASGGRSGMAIGNPSVNTWGAFLARIEFYNGNLITYYHTGNSGGYGTQYILQPATPNIWYHVKIETNTVAETYKVFIDGVQASSNSTGTTISEFPLLTIASQTSVELYGNSMIYFDDIKLYKTTNLIAHYPFNGNANDESGHELHGNVTGASLTNDRFGNPDSAYSFDGVNDIITVNHNDVLNSSNELSISVWVKPNTQQNAMILGKSNYVTNTNYLLRTKSSGYIAFEYKDFANSNSLPLIVDDWNHIAVVSQTDNSKLVYINGVLATHTTASSPFGLVNNELTIGARVGNEYFSGSIDDLRIYKSALTEQEVLNLFTNNSLSVSEFELPSTTNYYIYNNELYFDEQQNLQEIKGIRVYNLLAQTVFETKTLNQKTALGFLDKGIYVIHVAYKNGQTRSKKFVIH